MCGDDWSSKSNDVLEGFRFKFRLDSHLPAVVALFQGNCANAHDYLQRLIESNNNDSDFLSNIDAYVNSMMTAWDDAVLGIPMSRLENAPEKTKRYWSNVYFRAAGEIVETDPERAEMLFRQADQLAWHHPIIGSRDLVQHLFNKREYAAAFDEIRYAMTFQPLIENSDPLLTLYDAILIELRKEGMDSDSLLELPLSTDVGRVDIRHLTASEYEADSQYTFDYQVDDNWMLVGLKVDSQDLALSQFVRTKWYWRTIDVALRSGNEFEYIELDVVVRNLVPNAGFEWLGSRSAVRPFGYTGVYGVVGTYPTYNISILHGRDHAFCFIHEDSSKVSGLHSNYVESDGMTDALVQGGEYFFSVSGSNNTGIGIHWSNRNSASYNLYSDIRMAQLETQTNSWRRVATVFQIPDDQNMVATHLIHTEGVGTSCFDNLFLFELPSLPFISE